MPQPGAILVGATLGLGLGVIAAIPLLAIGVDATTPGGQVVLLTLGFAAQMAAGYVAGRVARHDRPLNGGLAALTLFAAVALIAMAAAEEPSWGTLVVGAILALAGGTAAGVLAEARSRGS